MTNDLDWTVESSELAIQDNWISLRTDECITSSGVRVYPYYVHEHPDWVSIFAMDASNEVILVREYHHGARTTGVGLPGGAVHGDNESPRGGALRELAEETGYQAGQLRSLGWAWANWGSHTNRIHYFLALECTRVGEMVLDDTEDIQLQLRPVEQFNTDELKQSYHRLNALMALDSLRSESSSTDSLHTNRTRTL